MNVQEFDINKAPPSDAYIKAAIAELEQPSTLFKRLVTLIAIAAAVSIIVIYILFPLAVAAFTHGMDFIIGWITGQTALNLAIAITVLMVIATLTFGGLGIHKDLQELSVIDSDTAVHIIRLCEQYPQIDAYRLAVLKDRQIVNADYEAIKRYLEEQSRLKFAAEQQAKIDAVQNPAPISGRAFVIFFDETTRINRTPEEIDRFYSDLRKVATDHRFKIRE